VFVGVGDVAQQSRPVASVVRLQRLHCCDMAGIESHKASVAVPREVLWSVFNGKLRAVLDLPGIKPSKLEDEVVQCGPEIVANFHDQDAE
jgi:hypothetical protein